MSQISVKVTAGGTHRIQLPVPLFFPGSSPLNVQQQLAQQLAPKEKTFNFDKDDLQLLVRVSGTKIFVPLDLKVHSSQILKQKRARLLLQPSQREPESAKMEGDALLNAAGDAAEAPKHVAPATPATEVIDLLTSAPMPSALASKELAEKTTSTYDPNDKSLENMAVALSRNTAQMGKIVAVSDRLVNAHAEHVLQQKALTDVVTQLVEQTKQLGAVCTPGHYGRHGRDHTHGPYHRGVHKHVEKESVPFRHNAVCDHCNSAISGLRFKCLACPDFDMCAPCFEDVVKTHGTHRFVRISDDVILAPTKKVVQVMHNGIMCDGALCRNSNKFIAGARYKCTLCPDFDLCGACEAHPLNKHDPSHPLIKMKVAFSPARSKVLFGQAQKILTPPSRPVFSSPMQHSSPAKSSVSLASSNASSATVTSVAVSSPESTAKETDSPAVKQSAVGSTSEKAQETSSPKQSHAKLQKPVKPSQETPVQHFTVICDGCDKQVTGHRYMCASCNDYDLCSTCFLSVKHKPDHTFVRYNRLVDNASMPVVKANILKEVEADILAGVGFECNECHEPIDTGLRATCVSCQNYDLCWSCSGKRFDTDRSAHKSGHDMIVTPVVREVFNVTNGNQSVDKATDQVKSVETSSSVAEHHPIPAYLPLEATFMEDLTIPDGSTISPGSTLVKQWSMKNTGSHAWPVGVSACFIGGAAMQAVEVAGQSATPQLRTTETVAPGGSTTISVMLHAPTEVQDNVISYWQLCTADGNKFGPRLWMDVDVQTPIADDCAARVTTSGSSQSFQSLGSRLVFPSASMELPKVDPHGTLSSDASEARSQLGHNIDDIETLPSDDEIQLSDESEFELLDEDSIDGAE
ncbi:hypothetical protein BCR37DRAFT_378906 [Protomyces lactucae-debilis]|uniref:ZZ-type domain-containing protein n=1 Tax=Protomyces lactucae-debilis TaxID=2754530 RepID=A0A1Y2FIY4_PROLT|nr:uncharacterized protein BCR37DRAFT_378906 [Protomyces lactucae-debilis]ORY83893.1 hypothetical protein BCR37DRAFT_378906 [Protomyces lactucae-debilis]